MAKLVAVVAGHRLLGVVAIWDAPRADALVADLSLHTHKITPQQPCPLVYSTDTSLNQRCVFTHNALRYTPHGEGLYRISLFCYFIEANTDVTLTELERRCMRPESGWQSGSARKVQSGHAPVHKPAWECLQMPSGDLKVLLVNTFFLNLFTCLIKRNPLVESFVGEARQA